MHIDIMHIDPLVILKVISIIPRPKVWRFKETSSSVRGWVLIWTLEPFSFYGWVLKWILESFWFASRVSSFETLVLVVVAVYFTLFIVNVEINPFMASIILLKSCLCVSILSAIILIGFMLFGRFSKSLAQTVVSFSTFPSDVWIFA